MSQPPESISPKSTHPRSFNNDSTSPEDQVDVVPLVSTEPPSTTSHDAPEHTSRGTTSPDPLELDRRHSLSDHGSKKPILQLPRPSLGHGPSRKKSQMDWLHGRHPSQLQEGHATTVGTGSSVDTPVKAGGSGVGVGGGGVGSGDAGVTAEHASATTVSTTPVPTITLTSTPLRKSRTSISGWTPKQGERESSPLEGDDETAEDDVKPIPVIVDVEEMPSAAVVAAAAGKSTKASKRSKQKASIKPERFYGTTNKSRDPFGSDDDDDDAAPMAIPRVGKGAGTDRWGNRIPTSTSMEGISMVDKDLREGREEAMSEGVGSSMGGGGGGGGDGDRKKKKMSKKKMAESGPGKAWRKGLKDVDRLAGRTPGTHSASSSVEPQAAPTSGAGSSKKRKQLESIALPTSGADRPKIARKGSSMMKGSEREGSDLDDEGGTLNRRRPSIDSSNDEADRPQTTIKPPQPPMPVRPETTGLTKAQLRAPANVDSLGHPIYSKHIPGKALPVYRIPSPVRNKEKELAVSLPLRDQVGPPPRGWQVGTRIVLGVGGAHLRLKSWMSTGESPFAEQKRAVAEQARLAHAQAMYHQQQLQLNGSQQPGYEQHQAYAGVSGWQSHQGPAGSSPYPIDSPYTHPYSQTALPGTQHFVNQLSPLPLHSGQMSPAQLPVQPPANDRAIYTAMPPLVGAKPKAKKRAAQGEGRPIKIKKAKKPFEPGDLVTISSNPTTPMSLPLAGGSSPILLPAASTMLRQPGKMKSPAQMASPPVLPRHISPPEGFTTTECAAPPPKPKNKRAGGSAAKKRVTADAMLGYSDDNVEILEAVPMAKHESGDSLDKEMEDLL